MKPGAQAKRDLPHFPLQQFERDTDGPTGIKPRTHLAGKILRGHGGRIRQSAIAADKFGSVACDTARFIVYIKKSNTAGKLVVIRIARKQNSAFGFYLRYDMHSALRWQVTQYPFDTTCCRELPGSSGFVTHFQYRKLHGSIQGDIDLEI